MKKYSIFLILILFTLFFAGCKYDFILPEEVPVVNPGGEPISFSTQIAPIFAEKCVTCHASQTPRLSADVAYSQIVPNYVNTTTPASSTIYINASSGNHNNVKVSATQAQLILTWITEGAKNN